MKTVINSLLIIVLAVVAFRVGSKLDGFNLPADIEKPLYSLAPAELENSNTNFQYNWELFLPADSWARLDKIDPAALSGTNLFQNWIFTPSTNNNLVITEIEGEFDLNSINQFIEFEFKPDGGLGYSLRVSKEEVQFFKVPAKQERIEQLSMPLPAVTQVTSFSLKLSNHMSVLNSESGSLIIGVGQLGKHELRIHTNAISLPENKLQIRGLGDNQQITYSFGA